MEIDPIYTFGSINGLTLKEEDKWRQTHVYALEDWSVITFHYKEIKDKIEELNMQIIRAEDSEFLRK